MNASNGAGSRSFVNMRAFSFIRMHSNVPRYACVHTHRGTGNERTKDRAANARAAAITFRPHVGIIEMRKTK